MTDVHHCTCQLLTAIAVKHRPQSVNICDAGGWTLLQMAVRFDTAQAVKELVDLGADVSVMPGD